MGSGPARGSGRRLRPGPAVPSTVPKNGRGHWAGGLLNLSAAGAGAHATPLLAAWQRPVKFRAVTLGRYGPSAPGGPGPGPPGAPSSPARLTPKDAELRKQQPSDKLGTFLLVVSN
jgi:hypothetical protein